MDSPTRPQSLGIYQNNSPLIHRGVGGGGTTLLVGGEEAGGGNSSPMMMRTDFVAPDTPSLTRRKLNEEEETSAAIARIQSHKDSLMSLGDEDRCLICMNPFTKKLPASRIPCSKHCNETPVHDKCVYEWKERQNGNGSCPLCRAPLDEMSYVPPDILRSATFSCFAARRDFVTRPVPPEFKTVRCYMRITRIGFTGASTGYEIFLQAPSILAYPLGPLPRSDGPAQGDQLLLVARKRFVGIQRGQIDITLDRSGKDYDRDGKNYLASVIANFSGLEHTIVVPVPSTASVSPSSKSYANSPAPSPHARPLPVSHGGGWAEIGCIVYHQNRFGRGVGPRKMRVSFPPVVADHDPPPDFKQEPDWTFGDTYDDDGSEAKISRSRTKLRVPVEKNDSCAALVRRHFHAENQGIALRSDLDGMIFGRNKEPYWLEQLMAYSLDFQGRVTLPSNKNFILLAPIVSVQDQPQDRFGAREEASSVNSATAGATATSAEAARTSNSPRLHQQEFGSSGSGGDGLPEFTTMCLQFGKVFELSSEVYTMDVAWPLSILQAAGVVLSSADRKLLCA